MRGDSMIKIRAGLPDLRAGNYRPIPGVELVFKGVNDGLKPVESNKTVSFDKKVIQVSDAVYQQLWWG